MSCSRCRQLLVLCIAAFIAVCARASEAIPGDELFVDGALTRLSIEVPAAQLEILRGYAFRREAPQEERPSVRCTVREGTNVWNEVALHLKGSAGSFRAVDDTPSFTLNFAKHVSEQRFHGLQKISLNTSIQDPTRVSEKVCRELYRRGGIAVPRAGFATLEFNGRRMGSYVLLEGWDRIFIQRHFADARGPLYEGRFLSDIDSPPKVGYGNTSGLRLQIGDLLAAARETNAAARLARLDAVLDLERFARLLALDVLLWHGDGYAFHANNYRILHDRAQERFVFLAHGLDQMFTLPDAPVLAGGDGLVAWAFLSLPAGRERVLQHVREFRQSFFKAEAVRQRALEVAMEVSRASLEAAGSGGPVVGPSPAVLDWVQRVSDRVASIDQQLAGISNLTTLRRGQSLFPANWANRVLAGQPIHLMPSDSPSLCLRTAAGSAGAWVNVQWLEHGVYRLEGRARQVPMAANSLNCGLRVRAPRKRSLGLDWGWDGRRRTSDDERFNLVYHRLPPGSGTNWVELSCEIDVRQPVAELEILCECSGGGEAWFDLQTLKLTRLTDPGR